MRYAVLAIVLTGAAMVGGCSEGIFDPKGPVAAAERQILSNSLGIMLAIVIPTILATLGVAWWFRSSNERARLIGNMKKEWLAHAKNVGFEPIDLCPRAARARWRGLGFSTSRWECMVPLWSPLLHRAIHHNAAGWTEIAYVLLKADGYAVWVGYERGAKPEHVWRANLPLLFRSLLFCRRRQPCGDGP